MKKRLLTLFVFVICSHYVHSQKMNVTFDDGVVFGHIKESNDVDYRFIEKSGVEVADSLTNEVSKYDSAGYITARLVYMRWSKANSGPMESFNYQKILDADGKLKEIRMNSDHNSGVFVFDRKGRKVSFSILDKKGIVTTKTVNKWNGKNQLVSYNYFGKNDSLQFERKFKYDKKGFKIEEDNFKNDGGFNYNVNFTYNSFDGIGNWTKRTQSGKFKNGTVIKPMITERKITYYNSN